MIITNDDYKNDHKINAIFLLCYGSNYYLIGLLCALYSHRKLIDKQKNNIDLVVMCDDYIYKFKDYILKYADRLINIKMVTLEGHYHKYKIKKYAQPWLNKIVNKWQCMYFDEYKQILFMDIDMLATNSNFYNIFNNYSDDSFVFSIRQKINKDELIKIYNKINFKKYNSYKEYVRNTNYFIDAGFIIIIPNRNLHNEYYEFIKTNKQVYHYVSQASGIDETSLLYFLVNIKNVKYDSFIQSDSWIVPWSLKYNKRTTNIDYLERTITESAVINYLSEIKPFVKPVILCWKEEFIWKIIEKRIISGDKFLKLISIKNALNTFLIENLKSLKLGHYIKEKSHQINLLINDIKQKFNINDKIFNKQAYNEILDASNLLMSFKDKLNEISIDIDLEKECCGFIKYEKYKELIE